MTKYNLPVEIKETIKPTSSPEDKVYTLLDSEYFLITAINKLTESMERLRREIK